MTSDDDEIGRSFCAVDEKPHAIMEVLSNAPRKGKHKYIVITVSKAQPRTVQIYMVKKQDGGDLKHVLLCTSKNIKKLDCRDSKTQPTYDLQLVTEYKSWNFRATKLETKSEFISTFCQLVSSLEPDVYKELPIVNLSSRVNVIPEALDLDDDTTKGAADEDAQESFPTGISSPTETYRPLTQREEEDIRVFLDEFSSSSSQMTAVEVTEMLQKQLADMEGTNIHTIMASESQVLKLMAILDRAIERTERLEDQMNAYHQFLTDVEEAMSSLRDRDHLTQITMDNRSRLLKLLKAIVSDLSLDPKYAHTLWEVKLDKPSDIEKCIEAAHYLEGLLNSTSVPGREHLLAAEELTSDLRRTRDNFSSALSRRVTNDIVHYAWQLKHVLDGGAAPNSGESLADALIACRNSTALRSVAELYQVQREELLKLAPLIGGWLQTNCKDYCDELKREYIRQIHPFFNNRVTDLLNRTQQTITNIVKPPKGVRGSDLLADSGSVISLHSPEASVLVQISNVLGDMFTKLRSLVNTEADFFAKFFNTQASDSSPQVTQHAIDVRTLNSCMSGLFANLESSLVAFVAACEHLQSILIMPMLVVVTRHLEIEQQVKVDSGSTSLSYIGFVLSKVTMSTKRAFNRYIERFVHSFREGKPSKKSRCGVIRIVREYIEFAESSMVVFANSSRMGDLERAHAELVRALMAQLEYIASQTVKTPSEVVQLENYHALCGIFRRLKMPGLEEYSTEAKNRYARALQEYTHNCMGRPLEKLATFFEGVQSALAAGMSVDVIQYQSAYSKHELRKVLQEYPGREVKRGLENLCKKVVKHLSVEGNLFLVVWRTIQAEFYDQYQLFNQLINDCYPDSGFALEFTVDDLKQYFIDIALQDNLIR